MVNLFNEELDSDFLVPDKLGLLVAEVDLELAVEFLVLDLDLGLGVKLAGEISIFEQNRIISSWSKQSWVCVENNTSN